MGIASTKAKQKAIADEKQTEHQVGRETRRQRDREAREQRLATENKPPNE